MKCFNSLAWGNFERIKKVVPGGRNISVIDELLLSEEISHFRKMNASEVEQELINLGLTTEPSDDLYNYLCLDTL